MKTINIRKISFIVILFLLLGSLLFYFISIPENRRLHRLYEQRASIKITDNKSRVISIMPNSSGYYALRADQIAENLPAYLIKKEDRFFFYHPGINPLSTLRAITKFLGGEARPSSSTITQQTVKLLLGQTGDRSFRNKLKEAYSALALDLHTDKTKILEMYMDTIFLGNQCEGVECAAKLYYNKPADQLDDSEIIMLLATINGPSKTNPFSPDISTAGQALATRLGVNFNEAEIGIIESGQALENFQRFRLDESGFETLSLKLEFSTDNRLTLDSELTGKTREIIKKNLTNLYDKNALNAAAVIIKTEQGQEENELLAIVGSPDPTLEAYGYKINMATRPRAIGSTIKPFIYTKAWEKGLRPYTLVDDREYKYTIGSGFAFYPKNYDYEYRGIVNLHYALSNSLNVPTVKVLEFLGLENFYSFLENDLQFVPVQDLANYQLGIALGELEMDLLSLTDYFTVFPNSGILKPLRISQTGNLSAWSLADRQNRKTLFDPEFVALTNRILSDRQTGAEEFGLKSDLNLAQGQYGVKTGTSREFHDSWTIGYTPDFTVGIWVGNAADEPMQNVSGVQGAGRIWSEIMNLLLESEYDQGREFDFAKIKDFSDGSSLEYGLVGDDYVEAKNQLLDNQLILEPHDQDDFLLAENSSIILKGTGDLEWHINGQPYGMGQEIVFAPAEAGRYEISGLDRSGQTETITIYVNQTE